jgi:hypothetical protein
VIISKETVRNEAVEGGVVSTAVCNKETLSNGSTNQSIINVGVGEE